VDLNAATIDKDSRHELTKRYEQLLQTFTSDMLELVETDSICLKVALDEYKASEKTPEDLKQYMELAGVNYESYTEEGVQIGRNEKQYICYSYIIQLMEEDKINNEHFPYLLLYKNAMDRNNVTDINERLKFLFQYASYGYKALFKVK